MPTLNAAFFDAVRPLFGGSLSQPQVDGLALIAQAWDKYGDGDTAKLAYILATAFHETAQTMQPIKEYGKGRGKKYGKPDETGKAPYGRGHVQLTWRENYVNADKKLKLGGKLAADYDLALDPLISVRVLITGMQQGWFTGKKLGDYIHGDVMDFVGARRIVNGTDKATLISEHARTFLKALEANAKGPSIDAAPESERAPNGFAALLSLIINIVLRIFGRKPS
jgi:putative chitinase